MSRWRWPVLALIVAAGAGLGSQLPRLRLALAPESVVDPDPTQDARFAAVLGPLSPSAPTILMIFEGTEPLSLAALQQMHTAGRELGRRPWVGRIDSLTATALPVPARAQRGLTLEDVDSERVADPRFEDALGAVIATDPARFPLGLASLRPTLEWGLGVDSTRVSEAERRRLTQALDRLPSLRRRMVDDSGRHLVLVLTMRRDLSPAEVLGGAQEVADWMQTHPAPPGVRQRQAGLPSLRLAMIEALAVDQTRLPLFAVLASVLVLWLTLRGRAGVALPMAAAGLGCAITVGAMAVFDQPIDLLTNVVPPLLITIGLGDAIHLVSRYREERRRRAPLAAAAETFRAMRSACFSTSLTTAIGFGSLAVSGSTTLARFGLIAALGVIAAYAVTIGALPATLPIIETQDDPPGNGLERAVAAIGSLARRSPWLVIVASVLLLGGALLCGARVPLDAALIEPLGADSPSARVAVWLERELDGYRVMEVAVHAEPGRFASAEGLGEIAALERWLGTRDDVLRVDGPASELEELWHPLARGGDGALASDARVTALEELMTVTASERWAHRLSAGADHARIEVRLRDRGERGVVALADAIEARSRPAGWRAVAVGGEATRTARGLTRLTRELVLSLAIAVALTFLVLGGVLRSPRLALISVLPNVLPLALAFGWMGLRGLSLHASSAIVFAISIGLAVDGTIHVLARYREELAGGAPDPIDAAIRGSGRAITIGVATLVAGFVALLFASFTPIRTFAEIGIVALVTAWICELVVLPALLDRFGLRRPAERAAGRSRPESDNQSAA